MLPAAWDGDADRRRRSHVPDGERHRPRWQHVLNLLDEMIVSWDMTPQAVLVDCQHHPHTEQLLRGLEERRLRYAVRVREDTPAFRAPAQNGRTVPVAELARMASRTRVTLTLPSKLNGQLIRSQFVVVPVPGAAESTILPGGYWRRTRRLVVEWRLGRNPPHAPWAPNLHTAPPPATGHPLGAPPDNPHCR